VWVMIATGLLYGQVVHYREAFSFERDCYEELARKKSGIVLVVSGTCSFVNESAVDPNWFRKNDGRE
jgi:hypothetical protein